MPGILESSADRGSLEKRVGLELMAFISSTDLDLGIFTLYAECIMRNAGLDEAQAGIKIAKRNINNHR